ncbi:DUF1800 domain-containing protein [Flavobacteriaceae bacterium]|nr:DUF1800 domain-containing protein [Flavobacteriaceae bacterium]
MSLITSTTVLGKKNAKHLLRRACFHYSKDLLDAISIMTPSEALNFLENDQPNTWTEPYDPLPSDDPHGYWINSDYLPNNIPNQGRKRSLVAGWWWYNMINRNCIKDKITFFLHTTFTASKDDGTGASTYYYDHLKLLEFYSKGSLKRLSRKITLDNAMLLYLDNTTNNADNPNENYAREFLELFTIGKGEQIGEGNYTNYTENDVQQVARVFSGFKTKLDRTIIDSDTNIPMGRTNVNQHDSGDKQFSSAFDNNIIYGSDTSEGMFQEIDQLVTMIFDKEATAINYSRKIYRFFVKSEWNQEIEETIIDDLASILISNNFEIYPALRSLLTSTHFYDLNDVNSNDEIIGSIVKSPLQLMSEMVNVLNIPIPNPNSDIAGFYRFWHLFNHNTFLSMSGMGVFAPETVAGYPAIYQNPNFDRQWFSSNTILSRYRLIECLITGRNKLHNNALIGTELNSVNFVELISSNPADPYYLVSEIAALLYPYSIDYDRINYFAQLLLDGYPSYYWLDTWQEYISSDDNTVVKNRLDVLITSMANAAENQLM